jgi:hypothetical protein
MRRGEFGVVMMVNPSVPRPRRPDQIVPNVFQKVVKKPALLVTAAIVCLPQSFETLHHHSSRRSRMGGERERPAEGRKGNYSHNHLLAAQERVEDELASSQGDGGVVVSHLVGVGLCGRGEIGWREKIVEMSGRYARAVRRWNWRWGA